MAKHYKTSPFIKTAFVAIALAASSMSSAAHAEDFLATFSTQGLSQLSLDANPQVIEYANPQIIETLQNLERGICPDPAKLKHVIKELTEMIIRNSQRYQDAVKRVEAARAEVTAQEGKIKAKKAELAAAGAGSETAIKLKSELDQLEAGLGNLQKAQRDLEARMNELAAKLAADRAALADAEELLKLYKCPQEGSEGSEK